MSESIGSAIPFYYSLSQKMKAVTSKVYSLTSQKSMVQDGNMYTKTLIKGIRCAEEEGEARLYLSWSYNLLNYGRCKGNYRQFVGHAETFLRDASGVIEKGLQDFPTYSSNMSCSYMNCLGEIAAVYIECHQVNDGRIDAFFELYRDNVTRYGGQSEFALQSIRLNLMRGEPAEQYSRMRQKDFDEYGQCPVCARLHNLIYPIATKQPTPWIVDMLERLIEGEFGDCPSNSADSFYSDILMYAVRYRNKDLFDAILEPTHRLFVDGDGDYNLPLVYAAMGDLANIAIIEDGFEGWYNDEAPLRTPLELLHDTLQYWSWFSFAKRVGVETVKLMLQNPPVPPCGENLYAVSAIEEFLEGRSDALGSKFDASRRCFDYASYKEICAYGAEKGVSKVKG